MLYVGVRAGCVESGWLSRSTLRRGVPPCKISNPGTQPRRCGYTCTCGPLWPGTAQAHKSTAHKGTVHKSTYLIMGRAVPARVPSHRPTARPTISYVCQTGPNSLKYLNCQTGPYTYNSNTSTKSI
jgi:hypothetical protein